MTEYYETKNIYIFNTILNYKLIGIGEFSHGIQQSWEFRFSLLKHAIKHTTKQITIFNEMDVWQGENIMNDTIWSREQNKPVKHTGIKKETPIDSNKNTQNPWGIYWQYIHHAMESKIFIKIVKYIRKHKDRIMIIGIDNGKIDRDYDMYKNIMKNYNSKNINFLWAHNDHIADLPYSLDNMSYIKNKNHKWFCGHYLKKKLKDDYCIILSQAHKGINRFNGYCKGENCELRTSKLNYFYSKFTYKKNKKYVNKSKNYQMLTNYDTPFIHFSNSYYKNNKYGVQAYVDIKTYNYVLFWDTVTLLEPVFDY